MRLPPWMCGVEARVGVRVQDTGAGKPASDQSQEPNPGHRPPLAPTPLRTKPETEDLATKRIQTVHVARHRVVVEPALHDRAQPLPELWDWQQKRVGAFHQSMDPVVDERIGHAVDKVRSQFSNDALVVAVDLTPEDVVKKYNTAARQQYDTNLRDIANTLQADLQAGEQGLDAVTAEVGRLPHPIDALDQQALSDNTRAIERSRLTMDIDRTERRLTGKTHAQVVDLYTATPDARDPTLIWTIEVQHAAGWVETPLTPSPDDAVAILKLRELIRARQQARVTKNHPQLMEARERLNKLRSATLDSQIRHLQSVRGLAAVR